MMKTIMYIALTSMIFFTATEGFASDGPKDLGSSGSAFRKIAPNDAGFEKFSMFGGSGGTAKYLVNDTEKKKFVGLFQTNEPLPEDNEWELDVDEYLTVTQGEITIEFVPSGKKFKVAAGEMGFIPAGSKIRLVLSKLPYAESFVMIAPAD